MSYIVGNIIRSTATFTPLSGTTTLGNISARVIDPNNTVTLLTVVAVTTNVYYADVTIADDVIPGIYTVRWESSSPKISFEDRFPVDGSRFPTP